MKRLFALLFVTLCTAAVAMAQIVYVHEFGKYSNEEFQLKAYDKDPSAEAVVIYDIGESHFAKTDYGFEVVFERKMKVKVFTKAGIKNAEISIPYYIENDKAESIEGLEGNTYNYEGGQIKKSTLSLKNTYNEKYNQNWYNKKFAMPDVKEGSIFEVHYRIRSPYLFNLRSWAFQGPIPVIHSEYTTQMIPFYEYVYSLQGAYQFDSYKSYDTPSYSSPFQGIEYKDLAHNFIMRNVPAFKDESFITSENDYLIKINFQLAAIHYPNGQNRQIMTTWAQMCKDMCDDSNFGKYMNNCRKKAEDMLQTMQLPSNNPREKAKQIERFVKTNFSWNQESDKYSTKSVKEFLTSKTGNCANINLFLTGMLTAAGLEAYPVLISTRDHGKINLDYPFYHFFNYVLVMVKTDSTAFLIDATEPTGNFNEIPSRCFNNKGLVIQKDKVEWVNLKSNIVSSENYNFNLSLTPQNDSIRQESVFSSTGYDAIDNRKKFSSAYKSLKTALLGENALPKDTITAINLSEIEKPFKIKFSKSTLAESIEDKIVFTPFCNFVMAENPLKQPTRNYPVDVTYKKAFNFQSTITIPKGYKLMTKPVGLTVNNKLMNITYIVDDQVSGYINIIGKYNFNKDVYSTNDYAELKKQFDLIVNKFNEKLIFVKEI
ncbi:MAG: transglutaminase domain-containing protein [Candidatus Saccharibacteria bacterium]